MPIFLRIFPIYLLIFWTRWCFYEVQAQKSCPLQKAILPCRCLIRGDEYQIWCTHSDLPTVLDGLRAVSKHIQDPIDELILENNYLPSLPGRTFSPLKVLRLMLRYNGLQRVSSDWLYGLQNNLMELFLVEPELRSLPDDSLTQMIALQAVTIQSDLMKRLPLFSGLPKLKYLQIEAESLIELSPRNFKDNPSLEKLHITSSRRLTRLEADLIRDLPSLNLLNISYCGINWLHPRAITRLPVLKELIMIGNRITDAGMIGRSSRELPLLETLRLDFNYIDRLGEAAFVDLPALKKLYLSNNRITELHHGAFHRVPELRSLDLNRNMLRRVHPESFLQQSGSGLEELWLIENDISHVADLRALLDALPRLTFLDISKNNLEAIPFGSLRGHPTLEHLNLDYNKIHLIDREAFMAMPALRELRLKNNSLSDSLEPPLWNLPQLKGLDLSENYFRRLGPTLLVDLPSLRKIDLSGNQLTLIDPAAFLLTPNLEHVNLSRNDLTTLHPATFRHLLGLYELDLSRNGLTEFAPGLPRGIEYLHLDHNDIIGIPVPPSPDTDLPALRMLDLSVNKIPSIPKNAFKTFPQLRRLYVGKNFLKRLEESSLEGLGRLEVLDLHENALSNIHPNTFKDSVELRELNVRNNRLEFLTPEVFKRTPRLKRLDLSKNQLAEILPGTLDANKELQMIDISHNILVQIPATMFALKNLRTLDFTKNRLKNVEPEILSSLISLKELKLSKNFVQELKQGAFNNLQHLKILHLDENEIELIEPNAIKTLPILKSMKLNRNKLKEIPNSAFNNLPSLQIIELQENEIQSIAPNAFISVPHLLMLNISYNQLRNLEEVGLRSLKSLEMLDISNNRLTRVTSPSLERMEWLVELRMDNNRICGVQGSPFNSMPRLRMLSMKNNRMMSFPEQAIQRIRNNIAVLDIEGNPLACACNMLWMQAWLHETSTMGPKCVNGVLLREIRLSREECPEEERNVELVAPGCEAELLSAPGIYGTSQIFAQQLKSSSNNQNRNLTKEHKNNMAPLPQESEYFYDEYVDYPYNGTNAIETSDLNSEKLTEANTMRVPIFTKSPHITPGDTPTLYAGSTKNQSKSKPDIPKGVNNSPSSSGFTFFGLPLPNLNNLLGSMTNNNGRKNDKKPSDMDTISDRVAIVNNPQHQNINQGPPKRYSGERSNMGNMALPNSPNIETGGFVPLLPGSGGFRPILPPNYNLSMTNNTPIEMTKAVVNKIATIETQNDSSNLSPTALPNRDLITATTRPAVGVLQRSTSYQTRSTPTNLVTKNSNSMGHPVPPPVYVTTKSIDIETEKPGSQKILTSVNEEERHVNVDRKYSHTKNYLEEHIKKNDVGTTLLPFSDDADTTEADIMTTEVTDILPQEQNLPLHRDFRERTNNNQRKPFTKPDDSSIDTMKHVEGVFQEKPDIFMEKKPPTALLIPGGQQPPFKQATVTKLYSPHSSGEMERKLPLFSLNKNDDSTENNHKYEDLEIAAGDPMPHNREGKNAELYEDTARSYNGNNDNLWYFANYNKTNLDPFVGNDKGQLSGGVISNIRCGFFKNLRIVGLVFLVITVGSRHYNIFI